MSIKVMSQVWELDLPATDKLILLGFADHANDEGICRPSFARIAWKCGISRETVKRTVRRLQESPGILAKIAEAGGHGYPPVRQILTAKGVRLTPFASDLGRSNGGHGQGERGSRAPGMGVTAVTPESKSGIEDLEPKSSSAQKKRGRQTMIPFPTPVFEDFKTEFPAATERQFAFAVKRILSRAKTPPRSRHFWKVSLRNFFADLEAETDLYLTDHAIALLQKPDALEGAVADSLKGEAAAWDLVSTGELIDQVMSQARERLNRDRVLRSESKTGTGPSVQTMPVTPSVDGVLARILARNAQPDRHQVLPAREQSAVAGKISKARR